MKKIALFFAVIILAITTRTSFAQEQKTGNSSIEIKNILPDHCVFSGTFHQEKEVEFLPQPLFSEGLLFFSCGHGLIWENIKPFPESLIYTSADLHYRSIPNESITPLESQQHYYLSKFLLNLLSADIDSIYQQFSTKKTYKEKNKNGITLLPKNKFLKKGLHSIILEKKINNKEESLLIKIKDSKENTTTLKIENPISYFRTKKEIIITECKKALNKDTNREDACDILSNPQQYHEIELSN